MSAKVFIALVAANLALSLPQRSFAQSIPAAVQTACASDVQTLCSGVPSGGGRIVACLKQHAAQVSDRCKKAIASALQQSAPAPSAPPGDANIPSSSPLSVPSSPAAHPETRTSTVAPATPGAHYVVMKQVKIVDQAAGQGKPAYDLLIPTAWQFKGWVNVGIAEGGCYADWFSVFGDAKSADNSVELQMLPKYTFQYIDDPAGQRQMQAQNQKDAQTGMKPCPVRAPVAAAEFLRQDLIARYRKGKTVVSIDPFPELNGIVRSQLGLPADAAGGVRTDAARARLSYDDDKGQPVEEWISAAIVTRPIQTGGAIAFDWHAVNVMFFRTPKGQLDANDKLFKLIVSTIRPEPEWQRWSDGVIASLYTKKQQELAKQSAAIAQFQMHVAQTINSVVANQQRGANNAAFGQDQLTRGVQTFRNPATGATFELSNQYDHAWLNGSNEYVMSDDPNFNPNGNLSGSWTEMQVVRPAP
jgi:hypothetical protein